MAKSRALYELIESLNRSEKRYFKVHASVQKTNAKLLLLFDLIDNMLGQGKGLDEVKLEQLASEAGLGKQLSVAQNRLTKLVLRHLRAYHSSNSVDMTLHGYLGEIELLYNRKLFDHCHKLIKTANKLALANERHLIQLQLLKWESLLMKEKGRFLHRAQDTLERIYAQELEVLQHYEGSLLYKFHNLNLLLLSRNKMMMQTTEELKQYKELIESSVFQLPFGSLPLEDEVNMLKVKAMYHFSQNDFMQSCQNFDAIVRRIEMEPDRISDVKHDYFMSLNNLLVALTMSNQHELYDAALDRLHRHFATEPNYEQEFFNTTRLYELAIYIEVGDLKRCLEIVPIVVEGLEKYRGQLNPINLQLFSINLSIVSFFEGDYSKAIRWLNEMLNQSSDKRTQVVSNLHYYGELYNLVLHYESEHIQLLEYLIGATRKSMGAVRTLNRFDAAILDFFEHTLLVEFNEATLRLAYQQLNAELKVLSKEPGESLALQYFDFIAWTQSKIDRVPMVQLVQQKVSVR